MRYVVLPLHVGTSVRNTKIQKPVRMPHISYQESYVRVGMLLHNTQYQQEVSVIPIAFSTYSPFQ